LEDRLAVRTHSSKNLGSRNQKKMLLSFLEEKKKLKKPNNNIPSKSECRGVWMALMQKAASLADSLGTAFFKFRHAAVILRFYGFGKAGSCRTGSITV
jgi:hypothetical protein